jgi:hypothetical protein
MNRQKWQISLRDILVLSLCVGALLAVWRLTDPRVSKVCINPRSSDAAIREQLLSYTPKGTDGTDALEFVLTKLDHEERVEAYSAYVKAFEARIGKRPRASATTERSVEVIVSVRPVGFSSEIIRAVWHFDAHDRVEDIEIVRRREL